MGIAERKEREKQQRRNDIIDAAERLFFKKGYENTTMDQVAEEAELSKGTLYLYFKNKEDLYLAINIRGMGLLQGMFRQAVQKGNTGIEKVENIGRAYYEFSKKYPDYFSAMIYYESRNIPDMAEDSCFQSCEEQGMQTLQIVADAVDTGMKDGTIRDDLDPLMVATILWGHTTGMIQILALKEVHLREVHGVNIEELIGTSLSLTARGLTPE
ncbi:MAG TPA: TetR/AcrR family transcriptional regulator [Caldithrix abyssi]|uniref:TetR/AcrR family transcriptional regulator n=1 Tax=Caldithrix abyssi TaxID=187145 RepID=A0A7V1LK03_CALAY|nr:TetR/AcrR family transcriptional regulator [Caldithrix abyssi]